jgi:hypothetical protein
MGLGAAVDDGVVAAGELFACEVVLLVGDGVVPGVPVVVDGAGTCDVDCCAACVSG